VYEPVRGFRLISMAVTQKDLEAIRADIGSIAKLDRERLPIGASLFILAGKIDHLIEQVEPPDVETERLRRFERDARAVLSGCYGIQTATCKKPDGSPVEIRLLDEEAVLRVLRS
jgi:hypothetical protein